MLDDQGLCCFQISIQYNRSDSLPTAPCSAGTRAEHSKQAARARPKGLARLALCPPPTETREKCRRSKAFEGYLRRKCGKSVGGPRLSKGTSDRNAEKVSEVQGFRRVPPTETREKCRRSRTFEGYLRQKWRESVGGQQEKEGTSDSFVVFLSEVPLCCCRPVGCRRKCGRKKQAQTD